jgi:hypothetical protein
MALTQNTVRNFKDVATSNGTKTTHSIQLQGADGKIIGMIQNWQPSRTRGTRRVFELNANTSGQGVDIVPGVVESDSLSVTRIALWTADLFASFSAEKFADAKDWLQQSSPFEVKEIWASPANGNGVAADYAGSMVAGQNGTDAKNDPIKEGATRSGGPSVIVYFGCWFTEITPDSYTADGDKVVSETATIEVLGRSYS